MTSKRPDKPTEATTPTQSRRDFLGKTAAVGGGLAGILKAACERGIFHLGNLATV